MSLWGKDKEDIGLKPEEFPLRQWRRVRRIADDPASPIPIGEHHPKGAWDKIRVTRLLKKYGCREKAPAFCPPLADEVLIEAFKDVETKDASKHTWKQTQDNLKHIGASAHALLWGMLPLFGLKEELVQVGKMIRDGEDPWPNYSSGEDSFLDWVDNLSADLSARVFEGVRHSLHLSGKAFNDQIAVVRKMVASHHRCKRLQTSLDKCAPTETHFCGNHTALLKAQMEASKLTDPMQLYAVTSTSVGPQGYPSRGRGNRGKSSDRGRSASSKPPFKSFFPSAKDSGASAASKPRGNSSSRPSRGGRGARRY